MTQILSINFILEDSSDSEDNDGYTSANGEETEYDNEPGLEGQEGMEGAYIEEVLEDEICEVSETFEAAQARLEDENEAARRADR